MTVTTRTRDDEWEHRAGRRLNYDGAAIRYEHPSGIEAYVEAMVNEEPDDPDRLEYRPAIIPEESGPFIEYPDIYYTPEEALDRLHELMDKHARDDPDE